MNSENASNISAQANSNHHFIEPRSSVHFRLALYIIVFLFSFLGNSIVIRAIFRLSGRKPLGYILVTNLGIAELGNTSLFTFNAAYEELGRNWIFGRFLCKIVLPLQIICFAAVGYTLASIAVYRWIMIAAPLSSRAISKIKAKFLILSTWAIGVAAALPALIKIDLVKDKTLKKTYCQEVWASQVHLHIYTIIYMTLVIFTPTVIIVLSYSMLALKLKQHIVNTKKKAKKDEWDTLVTSFSSTDLKGTDFRTMRLDKNEKPAHKLYALPMSVDVKRGNKTANHKGQSFELKPKASTQADTATSTEGRSEAKIIELENDLLKMIYIIVFISVICYLPIQIIFIMYEFALSTVEAWRYVNIVTRYSMWLTLLPSALHPLCYGTMSKFYAKVFSKVISCRK